MNIFDYKTKVFFKNDMCINISIYEERIMKYSKEHVDYFRELGQFIIEYNIDNPMQFIDESQKLQKKYKISSDNSIEIAHVLTYSVKLFREKGGGLLSLFLFSESDSWEPLPVIKKSLYSEMDEEDQIFYDNLPDKVMVYRGTSMKEYETGKFGQSWTLDKSVAKYFAFKLTQEKDNSVGIRIVLKTCIDKSNIYAYSRQNEEALCIIESDNIIVGNVTIEETNE
jgi:L-rhamnose mutarotase